MLVWGKDVLFDPDEVGSEPVSRYVKERAQYLPRREFGIGLVHWESHCRALASILLYQYNEAGEPPYKSVLDQWFGRYQEGRGAVFSTLPYKELVRPLGHRKGRLPGIFRYALRSHRQLRLVPVDAGYVSKEEARAEPLWNSHRVTLTRTVRGDSWRDLNLNRVQDLIDFTVMRPYTTRRIRDQLVSELETDGEWVVTYAGTDLLGNTQYDRVPFSALYADWRSFICSCAEALEYALGEARPELRRYSHVALQMMRAMGWNPGQGIGKHGQGRVEPIPTPQPPGGGGPGGPRLARTETEQEKMYAHERRSSPECTRTAELATGMERKSWKSGRSQSEAWPTRQAGLFS